MNSGKVILGVLAGAAAGALLGILFAPDKGSVTRKKISEKGEHYVDIVKDKYDEVIATITEKYDAIKDEVAELTQSSKTKFEPNKNAKPVDTFNES